MNLVYFNFLFIQTIKRKPIWITWILFLFTVTCFIIILPYSTGINTLQLWANTTVSFSQTIMGMVASIFTAVLAINIFKDTRDEGTELVVISKPISRSKIVLTKFFVFGLFCLMVNLSTLLVTSFTILLPETEPRYYAGLMISMLIGNAVTFGVFGAISILLSVKFAKMGVIIVNIVISLVFLIYQVLTAFVFNTPLKALDNKSMGVSNYMVWDRNTKTGEYKEKEVVEFNPSSVAEGKQHPCHATNWREMEQFWEHDIKSIDPTPILNVTDLASQISLTYMSYKTHEFSKTQAQRFFGISRFYDYQLTSPASPELYLEQKETLDWGYMGATPVEFPLPSGDTEKVWIPSTFCFPAVPTISETKIKGYGKEIPIGDLRTRELFSAEPIFFEKEDWMSFQDGFDAMYHDVFDVFAKGTSGQPYYHTEGYKDMDLSKILIAWNEGVNNKSKYYDLVWACLTGNSGDYMPGCQSDIGGFDKDYYHISNIYDLNERFMQFKHYCFYKALDEQKDLFDSKPSTEGEMKARDDERKHIADDLGLLDLFGISIPESTQDGWWMYCKDGVTDGLIEPETRAPCFDWMVWSSYRYYSDIQGKEMDDEEAKRLAAESALARYKKPWYVFDQVCSPNETQLFGSLEKPDRTGKYTGTSNFIALQWYPYMNGIFKEILKINIPLGQNMQLFFYEVLPKVNYYIYAIIWGAISLAAYAGGAIVYNKYDIK